MSTQIDPRRSIAAWLEAEAPDRASARLIEASRERVRTTRQRPAWWPARRTSDMNSFAKWAIAAAAVVVVAIVGYNLLPSQGGVGATPVSPSPSVAASQAASPSVKASQAAAPIKLDGSFDQSRLLDAGTYAMTFGDTGVDVQFTVPDGWIWHGGWFLSKSNADAPDGDAISFWNGDFQVYTDPCQWEGTEPHPPTGLKAVDLVTALAAQPQRNGSKVIEHAATASGGAGPGTLTGYSVDVTVPADVDFTKCDKDQYRSWGPNELEWYAQGPGQRDTVWAIDADPDSRVVVVTSSYPATPAATKAEGDQIIDSMTFSAN
jgi:hypothetical protein